MADFLLELRSEEIPARMQKGARAELEKLFRRQMDAAGVAFGELTIWSTPRRLALIARDLPTETEAVREEAKGPPEGAPDQAVDGFCRKNGVTRDQLEVREVKGRNTYFAVIEKPGQAVADLLAAAIPAIIRDFSWPKSMRWGEASVSTESLRWVRPLSGIVALFDGEVVPFVMDGTEGSAEKVGTGFSPADPTKKLASGRETMGHRFHSDGVLTINNADDYADVLRGAHVIVDHTEREAKVREGAKSAAAAAGLTLVEDEGLVVENAGLTEWPAPLLGRFDEEYLDVPPEVIQLTARVNQKYFVCTRAPAEAGASGGGAKSNEVPASAGTQELANAFICTANIDAVDPAVVVDGNRKVLAARLTDARFFWELDQKTTLAEHAKKLERITFHEKLGTVADKVNRVANLARWLCEEGIVKGDPDRAEQAARLCKADLVTEMVGEFPELQGLMGGYYAEKEGLPQEVSDAIRDHYKPVGQGDDVPTAPVTVAVSLADKLDTIANFFHQGMLPSGSKDPFALRRAAISTMTLIVENDLRLDLSAILSLAVAYRSRRIGTDGAARVNELQQAKEAAGLEFTIEDYQQARQAFLEMHLSDDAKSELVNQMRSTVENILDFFADRLKVQQREAGVRHDLIDAVFALGGEDDLVRLLARVKALQAFVETENGTNLLAGYKRAANILKKEGYLVTPAQAGVQNEDAGPASLDSDLRRNDEGSGNLSYTPEPSEKELIDALDAAEPKAAAAVEAEDFEAAMEALAGLRVSVDRFFEDVIVNAQEAEKREARLALLARLRDAVHRVADFSRIEG